MLLVYKMDLSLAIYRRTHRTKYRSIITATTLYNERVLKKKTDRGKRHMRPSSEEAR